MTPNPASIAPRTIPFFSPELRLAENQERVIRDKYLKDAPDVETWLRSVCRNIALAELLHHPNATQWSLFEGVRIAKRDFRFAKTESKKSALQTSSRVWLFHSGLSSATERDANFRRFLQNCERATDKFDEAHDLVTEWEEKFFGLLASWSFLPNSPTLMNAGRELQQLSACYVLPVEDSMEGITSALQAQALIHKSGGGTGFSFGQIRPAGDAVKSTAGVASGVVSFMAVFDKLTDVVKQGGNRRGANMGILPVTHPEIKEFINLKNRPGILENFNISVSADKSFMAAVAAGEDYTLVNPRTGQAVGRANAREVFNAIVENAWKSGDPGLIFLDTINGSSSNPTPGLGTIEATNPCGEQPLLPNEPCNLGSINLSRFVELDHESPKILWDRLREAVHLGVRFLDDVIDVNNYPMPEMELLAKTNRRIGLGIMGWAEMLVKLNIPYDAPDAATTADRLMEFVSQTALEASEDLARSRGVFPNWKNSVYDSSGPHFRGEERTPRNCARTTIAPTGTIGLAAGLQGAGIEPFYAIAYTRYGAKALDAIKNGLLPEPSDTYFEVNPLFKEMSRAHGFFGLNETELWKKIERNQKSVRGIPEIPAELQALFATAHDVAPRTHVEIQAAFQRHTDNAVSKTINLPQNATVADVQNAYLSAYESGCKGITVYRDRSKQQQVLNLTSGQARVRRARDYSVGVSSEYYEIPTGHGPLHVHIEYDEDGPYRVFSNIAPVGTEISGLTALTGVLISKFLEAGGDPRGLLKHLSAVKGDRPFGLGETRVNSIPHAVAKALRMHLKKHGFLDGDTSLDADEKEMIAQHHKKTAESGGLELWNLSQANDQCPECFGTNIRFSSGCSGPTCQDCGYSECS